MDEYDEECFDCDGTGEEEFFGGSRECERCDGRGSPWAGEEIVSYDWEVEGRPDP